MPTGVIGALYGELYLLLACCSLIFPSSYCMFHHYLMSFCKKIKGKT